MGTKSLRSSGTQHNPRGVTQGNTLVDPNTGLPIDVIEDSHGIKRLAVDAEITAQVGDIDVELEYTDDSVQIGDPNTSSTLKVNLDGSIDTNVSIDASGGDNIAISDGTDTLAINPDGSLNVNITSIGGLTTPTIANPITILQNTEYSYVFPTNTKKFSIRARGNAKIQLSFILGQSGSSFITIFPGTKHEEKDLTISSITAYFQSNKAGETIEILSWV